MSKATWVSLSSFSSRLISDDVPRFCAICSRFIESRCSFISNQTKTKKLIYKIDTSLTPLLLLFIIIYGKFYSPYCLESPKFYSLPRFSRMYSSITPFIARSFSCSSCSRYRSSSDCALIFVCSCACCSAFSSIPSRLTSSSSIFVFEADLGLELISSKSIRVVTLASDFEIENPGWWWRISSPVCSRLRRRLGGLRGRGISWSWIDGRSSVAGISLRPFSGVTRDSERPVLWSVGKTVVFQKMFKI